jgi:peptidoglycan hydrolase CwlO-like protein
VVPVISDSCSGRSGGFVPVVSFRLFGVLVQAIPSEDSGNTLTEILKELKGFREESSIMAAEVKEIKSAVNDLRASVEYTQAEVDSIKVDICDTKTELAEVKVTNSSIASDVESLKYKVLALERYSRNYNIRIGGIMELMAKTVWTMW